MTNGLGRGLNSLIPQKVNKVAGTKSGEAVISVLSEDDKSKILQVDPEKIGINPMQPRKRFAENELNELVESIKQYGIIQPLIVTRKGSDYELIAGERRLRSAKIAGFAKVPVIVRDAGSQEKLEIALIENIQRADLNPVEEALAYRKLIDEFNLTQDEVAIRVGRARPSVTNALRLLNLPGEIQSALTEGKISEGHAKLIVGLESEAKQMALYKKIVHGGITVGEALNEARRLGGTKQARIKINYADKDKEFAFREFFGTKAEVKRKGKGGQVIINFYSEDELDEIVAKVKK